MKLNVASKRTDRLRALSPGRHLPTSTKDAWLIFEYIHTLWFESLHKNGDLRDTTFMYLNILLEVLH